MLTLEFEVDGNCAVSALGAGENKTCPAGAKGNPKPFVRNRARLEIVPGADDERVRTSTILVRGTATGTPEVTETVDESCWLEVEEGLLKWR